MTLTVGSLFSGIGGIDLGLERAGMKVRWQVEIDPWCQKVLAKHWPDVERFADVREVGAHSLAYVDVIAGGFPCQDLSYAGKGAGITGARSGLWVEYARIIRELRPRYVFVENVPALLTRGMGVVLGDLAACGYNAEWDCIPAAAVGAPHRRDRVWIVAYPNANGGRFQERGEQDGGTGEPRLQTSRRRDAGGLHPSLAHPDNGRRMDGQARIEPAEAGVDALGEPLAGGPDVADAATPGLPNGRGASLGEPRGAVAELERRRGALRGVQVDARSGAAARWWATEPNVGRVAHGVPARVDRLRGLGNAVVPQVVEWIGRRIVEAEAEQAA